MRSGAATTTHIENHSVRIGALRWWRPLATQSEHADDFQSLREAGVLTRDETTERRARRRLIAVPLARPIVEVLSESSSAKTRGAATLTLPSVIIAAGRSTIRILARSDVFASSLTSISEPAAILPFTRICSCFVTVPSGRRMVR
jgi:hypothetical protein